MSCRGYHHCLQSLSQSLVSVTVTVTVRVVWKTVPASHPLEAVSASLQIYIKSGAYTRVLLKWHILC